MTLEHRDLPTSLNGSDPAASDPVRDPDRLAALRDAALLDTPAEAAFDRITDLVRRVLGVPVALVSLVDEDRQFFKSSAGLAEPWATRRETPLSHSFCQHVVASGEPLIIEDARQHPLVRNNLAIPDLHVIAYAGMPLVTADGYVLGTLCAIDTKPRTWSEEDITILRDLAGAVMTEIELRTAARRARDSQERLRLALGAGGLGSWELNLATGELHSSDACKANFGVAPSQPFTYDDLFAAIHPEDRERVRAEVERAVAHHTEYEAEYRALWTDGSVHWIVARGHPFYGADGSPERMVGVTANVTERKRVDEERLALLGGQLEARLRAERAETALRTIVEHVPAGIMMVDTSGQLLFSNQAARRIRGEIDEMDVLLHEPSHRMLEVRSDRPIPAEETPIRRALQGEQVLDFEFRLAREGEAQDTWIRTSAVPLRGPNDEITGAVAMFSDVTAQRAPEEEKAAFLAAAAHDLRSPLTAIKGFAQMLRRRLERQGVLTAEEALQHLQQIDATATRVSNMVQELLEVSLPDTAESPALNRQPTDLVALTHDLVAQQRTTSRRQIRFRPTTDDLTGDWDESRIQRVIGNLLTNAIKYSPEESAVEVSLEREDREGAPSAVLSVRDHGSGILERDLPRIFERFYRGSNVDEGIGGTGIGLAAVRHIVEQHSGTVSVQSVEGQGSRFTVVLPLEPAEE